MDLKSLELINEEEARRLSIIAEFKKIAREEVLLDEEWPEAERIITYVRMRTEWKAEEAIKRL